MIRKQREYGLVLGMFGLVLLTGAQGIAGGVESSGGGAAVVCRSEKGTIKSVELLDLFESHAIYGLKQDFLTGGVDQIYAEASDKLKRANSGRSSNLVEQLEHIRKIVKVLPEGTHLKPIPDSNEIALPDGCHLEQLAAYIDDTLLLIDRDLWAASDERNHAALFIHEAVYRIQRSGGAKDSRHSRRVVAYLFSDVQFESVDDGVPKGTQWCFAMSSAGRYTDVFWIYPLPKTPENPNGDGRIQFIVKNNELVFTKSSGWFGWNDWQNPPGVGLFMATTISSKFEEDEIAFGFDQKITNSTVEQWRYISRLIGDSEQRFRVRCE